MVTDPQEREFIDVFNRLFLELEQEALGAEGSTRRFWGHQTVREYILRAYLTGPADIQVSEEENLIADGFLHSSYAYSRTSDWYVNLVLTQFELQPGAINKFRRTAAGQVETGWTESLTIEEIPTGQGRVFLGRDSEGRILSARVVFAYGGFYVAVQLYRYELDLPSPAVGIHGLTRIAWDTIGRVLG